MASLDSIPIASQIKSLVQWTKGDADGARETQSNFSKQCIVVAQVRSAVEAAKGDTDAARKTQREFTRTAPIISQIRSAVEVSKGNLEAAAKTQEVYINNLSKTHATTKNTFKMKKSDPDDSDDDVKPKKLSLVPQKHTRKDDEKTEETNKGDPSLPNNFAEWDPFSNGVSSTIDKKKSSGNEDDDLLEFFDQNNDNTSAMSAPAQTTRKKDDIPDEFVCPISLEVMRDPVICADGHTYDRDNILEWFDHNDTSPNTNLPLDDQNLIPNIALKKLIEDWKYENGYTN